MVTMLFFCRSLLLAIPLSLVLLSCADDAPQVSLHSPPAPAAADQPVEQRVRIAVGGMITPREGMARYRELLRYVHDKIGVKVEYVDREGYAEINELLRTGRLEAAFVCSGPYVQGHAEFGLELLAAPQAYGQTVYFSYIIVPTDSPARTLADLRGTRFAFTDPLSNTGKLAPTYMLAQMGETPQGFFREFVFTKAHDQSIKAVAKGLVDGAAVDSIIWEYLNATHPELTSQTRILQKSPPYGIPPVAVPGNLAPELKAKLRDALLQAHTDPRGREILQGMRVDRFVPIADSAYDSVREMQVWLAEQPVGK